MAVSSTPYVTPAMLTSKPASVSWTVVPTLTADDGDMLAQLQRVCWTATSIVDTYCRQPLRAAVNTETLAGPGQSRVSIDRDTRAGKLVVRRWPVTSIVAVQTALSRDFPRQWTLVPAGQATARHPVIASAAPGPATGPSGGNVIDVAPGYIRADYGRGGMQVMPSYLSGWPHAGLTGAVSPAVSGPQTVAVDDVTGWAGWTGWIYEGQQTELVTVTAAAATSPVTLPGVAGTVHAGPGTLTLSQPLTFAHTSAAVISALPEAVIHASVLAATVQALETIDAISTQALTGQMAGGTAALAEESEMILDPFVRVA